MFRKRQGGNRDRVFHSMRLVLRFCQFLVVTRGIVNASNNKFPPSESSRFAFPAAVLRCGFYQGKPSYLRARAPSTTPSASPPFVLKDGADQCRSSDLNRPSIEESENVTKSRELVPLNRNSSESLPNLVF